MSAVPPDVSVRDIRGQHAAITLIRTALVIMVVGNPPAAIIRMLHPKTLCHEIACIFHTMYVWYSVLKLYSPTPERLFARYFMAWLQLLGQPPPGILFHFEGLRWKLEALRSKFQHRP